MLAIKEAIIVEGRYDKIRLAALFDTAVIETGGFRVFKDEERRTVIRALAKSRGIIVLTDSDGAGFVIRGFLKGIADPSCVKNAYVPDIVGKERRKSKPSKQGLLGVEGMTDDIIVKAVLASGATVLNTDTDVKNAGITKADFYNCGLTGRENSQQLRRAVLKRLGFPAYMTANALLDAVNMIYSREEFFDIVRTACGVKKD